jgi:hypothetical protein
VVSSSRSNSSRAHVAEAMEERGEGGRSVVVVVAMWLL